MVEHIKMHPIIYTRVVVICVVYIAFWQIFVTYLPTSFMVLALTVIAAVTMRQPWRIWTTRPISNNKTTKQIACSVYISIGTYCIFHYSKYVPGWLLKSLNSIAAPSSVSEEPGSVTWLPNRQLKCMLLEKSCWKKNYIVTTEYITLA